MNCEEIVCMNNFRSRFPVECFLKHLHRNL
ncbi:unnamed protein product [Onchocerca flexuosa]|uniref:Uncharacterized protein n=1 Tax=Onchocerca flexuosa TaxID=387005 RepID=A0A183I878_9BILA|nr:unnamed protein product [Onchocerca flexuosa]